MTWRGGGERVEFEVSTQAQFRSMTIDRRS
jgi:hypothetical protein